MILWVAARLRKEFRQTALTEWLHTTLLCNNFDLRAA